MKPFFRKPKPVEPSELERLASLWLQAGLILISLGIIATAATWWRSGWRVAAMPFLFFMLPAAVFPGLPEPFADRQNRSGSFAAPPYSQPCD